MVKSDRRGSGGVVHSSWFHCIVAVANDNHLILTCELGVIAETDCIQAAPSTTRAIFLRVLYSRQHSELVTHAVLYATET